MRMEIEKRLKIPLDKGHYGGPADTVANLLTNSAIPLGFYYGEDVVLDHTGAVRARPLLEYLVTYAADGVNPICVFKHGSYYYSVISGGKIQYYSSGWTNTSGSTVTFTERMHVDVASLAGDTAGKAIVSSGTGTPVLSAVSGTSSTETSGNAKGLAAQDEDRVFCYNAGYVWYSNRGDYSAGYTSGAGGQWFSLGPSCQDVIAIMNVAGSLHIIKQSIENSSLHIWRKVNTFSEADESIDMTAFSSPIGVKNFAVVNGMDGITNIGATIFMWARGQGLGHLAEGGVQMVSEQIFAGRAANLDFECILATADNQRLVLVKPVGQSVTYVYDVIKGTWAKWNINVVCQGYGYGGGMFGVAGTKSPARLGGYPTDTSDTTIVPKLWTPALDMDEPFREKFLTKILWSGRGVTALDIFYRLSASAAWTQYGSTITNPKKVVNLQGDCRGGEFYLKFTGNPTMIVKALGLQYDIGGLIYEG